MGLIMSLEKATSTLKAAFSSEGLQLTHGIVSVGISFKLVHHIIFSNYLSSTYNKLPYFCDFFQ